MLRHRRHQQLEGQDPDDDPGEDQGDVLKDGGGPVAEDGRPVEERLIGQELVAAIEQPQNMAAMTGERVSQAVSPLLGHEGCLGEADYAA